jgi:hypothetical protein
MAKMKRNRKYRSSVTSKSSWNKRVSCRQNMRKGRIKAEYKRQAKNDPNYNKKQEAYESVCCIVLAIIGALYLFFL